MRAPALGSGLTSRHRFRSLPRRNAAIAHPERVFSVAFRDACGLVASDIPYTNHLPIGCFRLECNSGAPYKST